MTASLENATYKRFWTKTRHGTYIAKSLRKKSFGWFQRPENSHSTCVHKNWIQSTSSDNEHPYICEQKSSWLSKSDSPLKMPLNSDETTLIWEHDISLLLSLLLFYLAIDIYVQKRDELMENFYTNGIICRHPLLRVKDFRKDVFIRIRCVFSDFLFRFMLVGICLCVDSHWYHSIAANNCSQQEYKDVWFVFGGKPCLRFPQRSAYVHRIALMFSGCFLNAFCSNVRRSFRGDVFLSVFYCLLNGRY